MNGKIIITFFLVFICLGSGLILLSTPNNENQLYDLPKTYQDLKNDLNSIRANFIVSHRIGTNHPQSYRIEYYNDFLKLAKKSAFVVIMSEEEFNPKGWVIICRLDGEFWWFGYYE